MKRNVGVTVLCLFLLSCGRSGPKPLTVEEIPAAISNVFKPARMLTRQNAESIAKQVQEKQYVPATIQLQALLPQELSESQRDVASASLQTLNQILQEQAATLQPAAADTPQQATVSKQPVSKEEAEAAAAVMQQYIRTK
jgi:hypothetical protein